MPLQFDSSRAPLTASDFKSLVLAVQGAGKGDEAEWIEWKSSLNLVTKEGLAAVARAIVGLANRVLPAATVHCEGRAYVLVGVEPGEKVAGIDEVDPAVVEDRLRPYLGDDGPRWAPHWVRIDGKSVLVIEVAAARDGDLIHHIRKQGPNVLDGEVFIRRGAKTLNPSSAELRALLRRYKALSNLHGLRVSLSEPSEIPVVDFSDVAIEKWIDEARTSLLRSLDQFNSRPQRRSRHLGDYTSKTKSTGPSFFEVQELARRKEAGELLSQDEEARLAKELRSIKNMVPEISGALYRAASWKAEDRSPEDYKAEVSQYLETCRKILPRVLRSAAGEKLPEILLTVTNETIENYAEVRVVIHVPGNVEAAPVTIRAENEGRLPDPPRPYGPYQVDLFSGLGPGIGQQWMTSRSFVPHHYGIDTSATRKDVGIRNGGSTTLTFSPVNLRPQESDVVLAPFVLLPQIPADSLITASWEATSVSVRGVARGSIVLPLGADPQPLKNFLVD